MVIIIATGCCARYPEPPSKSSQNSYIRIRSLHFHPEFHKVNSFYGYYYNTIVELKHNIIDERLGDLSSLGADKKDVLVKSRFKKGEKMKNVTILENDWVYYVFMRQDKVGDWYVIYDIKVPVGITP